MEYASWISRFARTRTRQRQTQETLARVVGGDRPYYLVPLQLHSDYQIRVHSPYTHPIEAAEEIVESFATHAPAESQLLFKRHPLDNHLFDYPGEIARIAEAAGAAHRVHIIDDGDLPTLLRRSNGVVLINSSIGTLALEHGCAVKALGTATYDMPGLTFQGSLNAFWTTPITPDPELYRAYRRVVIALTQVNGGFFEERAIELGTRLAKQRIIANAGAAPSPAPTPVGATTIPPRAAPALDAGIIVPGE
jgi:capsular polysaccharide export protein